MLLLSGKRELPLGGKNNTWGMCKGLRNRGKNTYGERGLRLAAHAWERSKTIVE